MPFHSSAPSVTKGEDKGLFYKQIHYNENIFGYIYFACKDTKKTNNIPKYDIFL